MSKVWQEILRSLYKLGEKDEVALERAVVKELITEQEKQEIITQ